MEIANTSNKIMKGYCEIWKYNLEKKRFFWHFLYPPFSYDDSFAIQISSDELQKCGVSFKDIRQCYNEFCKLLRDSAVLNNPERDLLDRGYKNGIFFSTGEKCYLFPDLNCESIEKFIDKVTDNTQKTKCCEFLYQYRNLYEKLKDPSEALKALEESNTQKSSDDPKTTVNNVEEIDQPNKVPSKSDAAVRGDEETN